MRIPFKVLDMWWLIGSAKQPVVVLTKVPSHIFMFYMQDLHHMKTNPPAGHLVVHRWVSRVEGTLISLRSASLEGDTLHASCSIPFVVGTELVPPSTHTVFTNSCEFNNADIFVTGTRYLERPWQSFWVFFQQLPYF